MGANHGLLIVASDSGTTTRSNIYSVSLDSKDASPVPLLATKFSESSPAVSADGRWLAYVSDETGRAEIYVRAFASPAGRIRLTTNGGNNPEWIGSTSRLVYGDGGRRAVAEIVKVGNGIVASVRDSLNWEGSRQAVDATGERVLVTRDPSDWRVVVVKNWASEAKRKLRAK